jgi:hypothetical protein
MSNLHQAFALQALLEQVGEQIKDKPQGRSYLSRDGRAYVLAVGGDGAREMGDFMTAVGQYLMKTQYGLRDKEAAKAKCNRSTRYFEGTGAAGRGPSF